MLLGRVRYLESEVFEPQILPRTSVTSDVTVQCRTQLEERLCGKEEREKERRKERERDAGRDGVV